jgi:hypothetical protein
MLNFISKWKAIKRILKEDEFFLMTASVDYSYDRNGLEPIKYNYSTNTNRELFYVFLRDFVKDLNLWKERN